MKREEIEPFLGMECCIHWRDPDGDTSWTAKPLDDHISAVRTLASIVGFNADGDLVMVGSQTDDGWFSDRNVIPIALIEKIEKIQVES